eukprot:5886801-Amphidinium_carterae.1
MLDVLARTLLLRKCLRVQHDTIVTKGLLLEPRNWQADSQVTRNLICTKYDINITSAARTHEYHL